MMYWIRRLFENKTFGFARSPEWNRVRREFLNKFPLCAVCERSSTLLKPNEIHHCVPFHKDRSLELLESNLITLCREHHLLYGHFMNWSSFNKDVRKDAEEWRGRIENRPK